MNLLVQRKWKTDKSTIGELSIDGNFQCYTLERSPEEGKGPIPVGAYKLVIDFSIRFGRNMPHILDVPNFEGVRIHSGNTAADTEGCLLVGQNRGPDYIGLSRAAFEVLYRALDGQQDVVITIQ